MSDDAYEQPFHPVPIGENLLRIDEEGNATVTRTQAREQTKAWKGAAKTAKLKDDTIWRIGERPRSGIVDYGIGDKITVSWRGKGWGDVREWLCHTCVVNKCQHTQRVAEFRRDVEGL